MKKSELLNMELKWKFIADDKGYYMVAVKHISDKRIVAYKPFGGGGVLIEWLNNKIAPRGWKSEELLVIGDIVYDIQKNIANSKK